MQAQSAGNARSHKAKISKPADRELIIERTFKAPRALVFEVLTRPEHVRNWYGLRDHTMPVCNIDLRPGGKWRYVLRDPNGQEYAFRGEYREIAPPARIVSTEEFEGMPGTEYVVTMTLEEKKGVTTLRSHLVYQNNEHREGHIASGMERGMNETFDRLDEYLETMSSAR